MIGLKILSTVAPNDTYFVLSVEKDGIYCQGTLMFWVIAEVAWDAETVSTDMFPICTGAGTELAYQIERGDKYVHHWSEMRQQMNDMKFYDGQWEQLTNFLEVLESRNK